MVGFSDLDLKLPNRVFLFRGWPHSSILNWKSSFISFSQERFPQRLLPKPHLEEAPHRQRGRSVRVKDAVTSVLPVADKTGNHHCSYCRSPETEMPFDTVNSVRPE